MCEKNQKPDHAVLCVRETEVLGEQQPPKGVFISDHACLVIKSSSPTPEADGCMDRDGAGVYDRL